MPVAIMILKDGHPTGVAAQELIHTVAIEVADG